MSQTARSVAQRPVDQATHDHSSQKFYLPSLDVLRFFAFLAVFVMHTTPGSLGDAGPPFSLTFVLYRIHASLGYGVSVFFALSAFLITTLLLRELESTGRISLKRFYFRRILRIWPVFFGALVLGGIIVPLLHGEKSEWLWVGLFASFFGNHFVSWPGSFPGMGIAPLWSVCVEEQFYLVWPWLVKLGRSKWLPRICWFLLLSSPVVRMFVAADGTEIDGNLWFMTVTHLDCFAAGGLVALTFDSPLGDWLGRNARWVLPATIALIVGQSVYAPFAGFVEVKIGPLQSASYSIVALGSAAIVLTVAKLRVRDDQGPGKALVAGGKLSYSLYAFHGCMIELGNAWFHGVGLLPFLFEAVGTTTLAAASYYGVERRFLRFKDRFQTVKSGPT